MSHHRRKDSLFWGLILILVGIVFLLEQFDIEAWDYVWKFWPLILIVWGATKLIAGIQEKSEKPAEKTVMPPPQV